MEQKMNRAGAAFPVIKLGLWGGFLMLFFAFAGAAQDRGTITGVVTDPAGASVPDATVEVTSAATNRRQNMKTTVSGTYAFGELPAGLYTITVTKSGFETKVVRDVRVVVGTATRIDVVLAVGQVTQQVQVTAQAALLQTDTTSLGSSLSTNQIIDLPLSLAGTLRSSLAFVTLTPGTYASDPTNPNTIRVGGGLGRSSSMLLDGGETTTASSNDAGDFKAVSVEAIQEFKIQTGTYSAEYGRMGNGVYDFATKSGTNHFHGELFEYLRNTALNARGFYNPNTRVVHQNDFGGTAGGPVYLPHIYDGRNKLFFFFAWESSKFTSGASTSLISVPTMAMRHGDFSGWVDSKGNQIPIYNPSTHTQFPGNIIPASSINPQAAAILAAMPAPQFPGLFNNILSVSNPGENDRVWSTKIDWYATPKSHFAGLISQNHLAPPVQIGPLPGPLGNTWSGTNASDFFRLSHDYTITPSFLNRFLFSITLIKNRNLSWSQSLPGFTPSLRQALALKGVPGDPSVPGDWNLGDGYPDVGGDVDGIIRNESWQIGDTLDKIKGAHDIKFGFEYLWAATARIDQGLRAGMVSFADGQTGLLGAPFQTGASVASFELGLVNTAADGYGDNSNWGQPYYAWFVQDDWKVTHKLTANLGLRYEIPEPPAEKYGNTSILCFTCPNSLAGEIPGAIIFGGTGPGRTGKHRFYNTRTNAWGPRLGLAYLVKPNTVLRAGGGLYYSPIREGTAGGMAMGFTKSNSFSPLTPNTPVFTLLQGFPPASPGPVIDPTICTIGSPVSCNPWYTYPYSGYAPRFGTWNATVEHRLGSHTTVTAAYQGSAGVHLFAWKENPDQLNPQFVTQYGALVLQPIGSAAAQAAGIKLPYPTFPKNLTVGQALRPLPQYLGLTSFSNADVTGHSTFHALELSVARQMSHGLWLQAAYTWSKLISNVQYEDPLEGIFDPAGEVGTQNAYDRRADKSVSPDDTPHRLVLSYIYDLPVGRGRRFLHSSSGVVNTILGGWEVSAIQQYQSGFPLNVSSTQTNGVGTLERANVNLGVSQKNPAWNGDPNATPYLNAAAFSRPAFLTFGNAPAYLTNLRGPALLDEDFTLGKDFFLGNETRKLSFKVNFFNAFNRVRFGNPNTRIESPAFGKISSQLNNPREIQMALRLQL